MDEKGHFRKLNDYFRKSEFAYDFLLGGAKHFGYYPKNKKIPEKVAQRNMHDLIGEKLNLSGSHKVLDAGCGQGVVSVYLARKFGCKIFGITMVEFEVGKANALAKKNKIHDRVTYRVMDYSNMKFNNGMFDRIYTIETLCHSTNLWKTMREFFRVLKKRGRFAFFEYNIAFDKNLTRYEINIIKEIMESTASPSLTEFRPGNFEHIMKKAGFKNIKTDDITENFRPSLKRLRNIALVPYFFVKLLRLQKYAPNLTIAVEFFKMVEKGSIRYIIFTGKKY